MTLTQFEQLWRRLGTSPEGAVRCLLIAVLETFREHNPDGPKMWGTVLPDEHVDADGRPGPSQQRALNEFGRRIAGAAFDGAIAASYLGGTPANGYDGCYDSKLVVAERESRRRENEAKLFVRSSGKSLPSPVFLRRGESGYWKPFEYASLHTAVHPVVSQQP